MKNIFASALVLVVAASLNGAPVSFTAKDCEVVIAPDAPKTVRYAADELSRFLGKTLGGEVPVCTKVTEGRPSIVLGTNAWSRAAGLAPEKLPRDGYCIKTARDRVYIAGCDDPSIDMASMVDGNFTGNKNHYYERGTYFGVIEFLERFAGVRFYFPGELGTVIQPKSCLSVADIDITDSPDFTIRFFSGNRHAFGEWFEPITSGDFGTMLNLFKYRLRFETEHVSCCHGQFRGCYPERFAKTHPEYIRMNEKGERPVFRLQEGKKTCNASQLCQSSDVWEEIYRDAKAFFDGKPASARAIPRMKGNEAKWGSMAGEDSRGKWFDVMPNDAFAPCYCEKCQAEYDKNDTCDYATELVWRRTVELANRLKAEGVKGRLTQMAYRPYRKVPSIDIPDNVDVMVSESGPWSVASPWKLKRDNAEIESWYRKLGRKVWLWNYVLKHGKRNIPGLPALAPHAYGTYYKSVREWACGAYAESSMDRFFMNALNLYVFAKVCWDLDTDVEALIEEHHRLMFGAAAPEMAKLYGLLEEKWTKGVVGKFEDGPRGPFLSVPPESELRTKVYTKAWVAELDALIATAIAKVVPGSLEARRIDVVRREFRDGVARFAGMEVPEVKQAEYPDRWVHVRNDLVSDARLNHFGRVIARAAESGFNGVMWDAGVRGEGVDFDGWKGDRLARLEKAKAICREKGLEIIPMVWSVGRAHALLNHDPTLAECQPVRGVPYRANDGKAEFEAGNAAVMKDIFGGPVTVNASGKRARSVKIKVKPFRRYRLTAHAVQKGFKSAKGEGVNKVPVRNAFSISATPLKAGQNLNTRETVVGVSVADGESDLVLEFLSLDFGEEMISVGVNYRSEAGEVTFTDVHVAEVGIRRPIVREGAPFVVRDAATGAIYEPGKDYVVPKSDASPPGPNDRDVTILLPPGSAIRSGASLVVEAYEPSRRRDVQAGACMANPALYAYFEKSAPVIYELFGRPKKWFLSMDEIRAGGMCGACEASGKDLAHLLADCLAHQRDAIRKVCPDATVYAWCDMYDPFVNAKSRKTGYAMCNGDFSFNEFIAPKDIVAVVWGGQESASKSLEYFSSLGIPTLYATFYDVYSADHFRVRGAVPTANKVPGCRGLMYTTWVKNGKYDLLGAFGDFMKAYSNPMPAK